MTYIEHPVGSTKGRGCRSDPLTDGESDLLRSGQVMGREETMPYTGTNGGGKA